MHMQTNVSLLDKQFIKIEETRKYKVFMGQDNRLAVYVHFPKGLKHSGEDATVLAVVIMENKYGSIALKVEGSAKSTYLQVDPSVVLDAVLTVEQRMKITDIMRVYFDHIIITEQSDRLQMQIWSDAAGLLHLVDLREV